MQAAMHCACSGGCAGGTRHDARETLFFPGCRTRRTGLERGRGNIGCATVMRIEAFVPRVAGREMVALEMCLARRVKVGTRETRFREP